MTAERDAALQTLSAIASTPEAVGASSAHFLAALDALVVVYRTTLPEGATGPQQALRSPRAAWMSIFTHAQHRVQQLKAAA